MRELLCLVFLDITESLFRARIPIIEYRVRDPYLINHHAGLCGSLLPILYRVCLLGAAIRKGSQHPVSHNCFDILREEIVAWAPSVSAATAGRFSEEEMLLLLTQANLHRNAALLILHRLRFPFGDQDDDAEFLSQTIIREMQYCLAMTKHYPPNISLVLPVAGAEVQDSVGRENILSSLQRYQWLKLLPLRGKISGYSSLVSGPAGTRGLHDICSICSMRMITSVSLCDCRDSDVSKTYRYV